MKKITLISLITASCIFASSVNFKEAKPTPQRFEPTPQDMILSYHDSIKNAKKSVVNVATSKTFKGREFGGIFQDPFFEEFFGRNFKIPEQKRKSSGLGSGVIISSDGYIITNNHVIDDADNISVSLLDSDKEYKAKLIGADPKTDLAVIKIEEKGLNAITFANSSNLEEGDVVFAIGNPFGIGGSITQGIISALNKNKIGLNQYENFIQTDASINPGNSGGALVDSRGALVGINSAIISRSGGNNGIGFAIPSNMAKNIAKTLIEKGKIERGYLGVSIADLTKELKDLYKNQEGALILSTQENYPADKAGLKRGDLIIKIDDKNIKNANELKNLIASYNPNKTVEITYERDAKIKTTDVKLAQMSNQISFNDNQISKIDGLSVSNITRELKKQYSISQNVKGVIVTKVKENSPAQEIGFKRGDIIIQIEHSVITNIDDFEKAINKYKGRKIRVYVNRQGYIITPFVLDKMK